MTKKKSNNNFLLVLSAIASLAAVIALAIFAANFSLDVSDNQHESLETAIRRCVVHYYATNGRYPESMEVISENYGITYDPDDFTVHYSVFASNLVPDITIISKS